MPARIVVLPRRWRAGLRIFRAVLAASCLITQLLLPGPVPITALAAGYLAYSLLAFTRLGVPGPRLVILGLGFETVFFFLFAAYGVDPGHWLTPLLYLNLLLATSISQNWGDVFLVVGLSTIYVAFARGPQRQLRQMVTVAGLVACVLAYQKRRLQTRLVRASRRERVLRQRIERVRQAERVRIAGDIHDGPLQSFIGLQVRLEILKTMLSRDAARGMDELREIMDLLKNQIGEFRSFLRTMKPSEPEGDGLMAWMRRVVEEFQKDTGIPTGFTAAEGDLNAPVQAGRELLQILREALHNVQKHSRASRVAVSIGRRGRLLELAVDDNGAGFSFSGTYSLDELETLRLGPQSIERRVRELGGEMLLESRPGRGAGLKIRIPA